MNGVYVALIGPFGVGKSSLAKELVRSGSSKLKFKIVKQVTSRQRRPGEDDLEYEFISEEQFQQSKNSYLKIQPNRGVNWHYAYKEQPPLVDDTVYLYIVLPETAQFLKQQNPQDTVICAILPPTDKKLREQLIGRDNTISEVELDIRLKHLKGDTEDAKALADIEFYNDGDIKTSTSALASTIENYLIKRSK
jgi:guanylate kinase